MSPARRSPTFFNSNTAHAVISPALASTVAADGAELARSAGLDAEPQAVPEEVDVADRLIEIARERGAAVVVVGSHGISGLRKRLLGSVSRKLIEHCDRPVLVVRG